MAQNDEKDLTLDSPIRELFKRWKIEAGYMAVRQEVGTAADEDGRTLEITSGHGLGTLNVWFKLDGRKDKFILDMECLLPLVFDIFDATPEDAPLKDDEYRKGVAKKVAAKR